MSPVEDHISGGLTRERLALELRRARRPFVIWTALVALGVLAFGAILSKLELPWPWQHQYTFKVAVADVTGVVPGNEVRIAGVPVGHVTGVSLGNGGPVLTAEVDEARGPLYRNARLELRPKTPLQDMYLDVVTRGTPRAGTLEDGETLRSAQTTTSVAIGDVVNIFDAAVRPRVRASIDALGAGLGDHGADLRQALVQLAPFLDAARNLTQTVAQRRQQTRALVHNLGLMTSELARRDAQVSRLVRGGAQTLGGLAAVEQPLSATLRELPATLAEMPSSFRALSTAAGKLDPAVAAVMPAARALDPALASLRSLSPVARTALTALDRPLPRVTALLRAATPAATSLGRALRTLGPQIPRVDRLTAAIVPCELAVDKFFNWTLSTMKYYDADGVIPRASAVAGPGSASLGVSELTAAPSCAGGGPRK